MGWYQEVGKGKGMYLKRRVFLEKNLRKYMPKAERIEEIVGMELPVYEKLGPINQCCLIWYIFEEPSIVELSEKRIEELTERDVNLIAKGYNKDLALSYCLAFLFAEKYGYPRDAFKSCSDHLGKCMIYCNIMYPLSEYNENIAKMTEAVYGRQLAEFLNDITMDHYDHLLEICEENAGAH